MTRRPGSHRGGRDRSARRRVARRVVWARTSSTLGLAALAAILVVACATTRPMVPRDGPPDGPALVLRGDARAWLGRAQTYARVCIGDAAGLLLDADATLRVTGSGPVVLAGAGVVPVGEGTPTLTLETSGPVWIALDLSRSSARVAGNVGALHVRAVGSSHLHLGPITARGDIVTLTDGDTTIDGDIHATGVGSFLVQRDPGAFPTLGECEGS